MFKLIEEPASIISLQANDKAYAAQNTINKNTRFLHTAYGGIKLNNLADNNKAIPKILGGSVCLFAGSIYVAQSDITLIDTNTTYGNRYFFLEASEDGKHLIANVGLTLKAEYSHELGGFYNTDKGIKKYLNFVMVYYNGEYLDKTYFNIEKD